jgi:hypothetical protein
MSKTSKSNRVRIILALVAFAGTAAVALCSVAVALINTRGPATIDPPSQDRATIDPPPVDLSGTWHVQTTTKETPHSPFINLVLRYKILLTHDEEGIIAHGNKTGEVCRGKALEYSGKAKAPIELTGSLGKDDLGQTLVRLNGQEKSSNGNSYATAFQLKMVTRSRMIGTFSGNIANAKGEALWIRESD